jgi:hypothetical protein
MQWLRTFHDRESERLLCIYRSESETDIRTHALAAGLPCDTVIPVDEVLPSDLDEPAPEDVAQQAITEGRPALRTGDGG